MKLEAIQRLGRLAAGLNGSSGSRSQPSTGFVTASALSFCGRQAAFSLVEVTLALGIMSFALVGLLGMLPVGLSTFRDATSLSVGTQIAQRLLDEAQQTDFDQLVAARQTLRYFDVQGNELPLADKTKAVYHTNLVVTGTTTLPGAASNQSLATVLLQFATNPGNRSIATDADLHWSAAPGLTIATHSTNVARNK